MQLTIIDFGLIKIIQNGSACLRLLLLEVHLHKARNWYRIWLPLQHTSTTHIVSNSWRIYKSTTMFLLGIPLVRTRHMCQEFTISWHSIFYFTVHSSDSMVRQNILKRTRNLWKPPRTSHNNNGQQYKRWRLCLLVLQNTPCLRLKFTS